LGVFNIGLGLPPVAVGLAVAFAFWRSGPLGSLALLYTPIAMILSQTIVVTPLIGTLAVLALRRGRQPLWLLGGFGLGGAFVFASQSYYHYFVPVISFAALLAAPLAVAFALLLAGRRQESLGLILGGNILAATQTNVKRLLAYSSIAHTGYMLVGLASYQVGANKADRRLELVQHQLHPQLGDLVLNDEQHFIVPRRFCRGSRKRSLRRQQSVEMQVSRVGQPIAEIGDDARLERMLRHGR